MKTPLKQAVKNPWFIRKVIYLVVTLVMVVLATLGVVTMEQADTFTNQAVTILAPFIGALVAGMAGANTHADSDRAGSALEDRLKNIERAITPQDRTGSEEVVTEPSTQGAVEEYDYMSNDVLRFNV